MGSRLHSQQQSAGMSGTAILQEPHRHYRKLHHGANSALLSSR